MLNAALAGDLDDVPMREDPIFRFQVPETCPGVPAEILNPANTWSDPADHKEKALQLARAFQENFVQFEKGVSQGVKDSEPRLG